MCHFFHETKSRLNSTRITGKSRINPLSGLCERALSCLLCSAWTSEPSAAYGRGRYMNAHSPMTTCTVGYRNVSDMCNFLVVWGPWVTLCLDWRFPQQLWFPREQLQNSSIPYLPSLQSGDTRTISDYTTHWVGLQNVCRARSLRPLVSGSYRHLLLIFFFPSTFCIWLHLQDKIQTIIPYSLLFPEALRLSSLLPEL